MWEGERGEGGIQRGRGKEGARENKGGGVGREKMVGLQEVIIIYSRNK